MLNQDDVKLITTEVLRRHRRPARALRTGRSQNCGPLGVRVSLERFEDHPPQGGKICWWSRQRRRNDTRREVCGRPHRSEVRPGGREVRQTSVC